MLIALAVFTLFQGHALNLNHHKTDDLTANTAECDALREQVSVLTKQIAALRSKSGLSGTASLVAQVKSLKQQLQSRQLKPAASSSGSASVSNVAAALPVSAKLDLTPAANAAPLPASDAFASDVAAVMNKIADVTAKTKVAKVMTPSEFCIWAKKTHNVQPGVEILSYAFSCFFVLRFVFHFCVL
jgi:hypothetical protein